MFANSKVRWRVRGSIYITYNISFVRVLNFKDKVFECFQFVVFKIRSFLEIQSLSYIDPHTPPPPPTPVPCPKRQALEPGILSCEGNLSSQVSFKIIRSIGVPESSTLPTKAFRVFNLLLRLWILILCRSRLR
jgi:hypothetical protein